MYIAPWTEVQTEGNFFFFCSNCQLVTVAGALLQFTRYFIILSAFVQWWVPISTTWFQRSSQVFGHVA